MSTVIVPDSLKTKLGSVDGDGEVELILADGTVLGSFRPSTVPKKYDLEPKISYEEAQRRLATEKGRPLKDILRDLEARG